MKKNIHPNLNSIKAVCSCGAVYMLNSVLAKQLSLDVCSSCHPFYTGKQKLIDTAGRVEKFMNKYKK